MASATKARMAMATATAMATKVAMASADHFGRHLPPNHATEYRHSATR